MGWYRGEAEAFTLFFARHHKRVIGYCRSRGLTQEAADEVAQEAFLRLHKNVGRYDPARPALPWFFVVVRNALVDHVRREGRNRRTGEEALSDTTFDMGHSGGGVDLQVEGERLRSAALALESLSPAHRTLVEERLWREEPYAAIAQRTGKSEQTLRKRFERVMKSLKERFGGKEES